MRAFFLTREWSALERLVRRQVDQPEGMPSVYQPWLHYQRRGYEVHVFMVGDFDAPDEVDYRGVTIHLVPRGRLGVFKRLLHGVVDNLRLYRAARRGARCGAPDVVYTLREGQAYAAWALARRFRAACVKRIYGTFLYSFWFLERSLRLKISCLRSFLTWLWPADLLVITNDGTSGDKVADWLHIPRRKVCFWLNGISKEWADSLGDPEQTRREVGLEPGERMILSLGRIAGWKRYDRAVRALALVREKVPQARLVIAGDGPERENIERLVDELNLRPYVKFLGMVAHQRVRDLMSATDVFLLPYDLTCLCNTLLESQVCGAATVTWDIGDTRTVVTDNDNGRLLPDAEPATLAEAVVELLTDEPRRQALKQGALRYAQEQLLPWDRRMDKEIDRVEAILHRRRGRRGSEAPEA